MKAAGYTLIIISWLLIITGIIYEIVLPYDYITSKTGGNQSKEVTKYLSKLYWYFIPAAVAGFTGGLLIHKHKKDLK